MAFLSSILKLRLPSRDGSDAADLANIIADLGEDVDAKVGHPSLTTAQILALTGDEKAAGRRVWDVTAQVEKVSNGTTWVEQASRQDVDAVGDAKLNKAGGTMSGAIAMGSNKVTGLGTPTAGGDAATKAYVDALDAEKMDTAGGTFTGRPVVHQASGYSQIVLRNGDAAYWISTDPGASDALTVAVLNKDTLAWVKTGLVITKDGHVESASHVGGVFTGTTNAAGQVTIPLPTSRTGVWAVTLQALRTATEIPYPMLTATSATQASVIVVRSQDGSALGNTPVTIHWQAIAY